MTPTIVLRRGSEERTFVVLFSNGALHIFWQMAGEYVINEDGTVEPFPRRKRRVPLGAVAGWRADPMDVERLLARLRRKSA